MNKESPFMYQILSTLFCVIVILSNVISAKMVPLFGLLVIPAGLITYPLTFILSDLVTEFYGAQKAKRMVYTTLGMNFLTFGIIQIGLLLPSTTLEEHQAFQAVLGLSGLRIFSSLAAFTVAQLVDIQIYALIKRWTGFRYLWVRSNGSTWLSQAVDTFVVDIVYLYWGMGMGFHAVLPIMLFSLAYKLFFSVATTPLFYLAVYWIKQRTKKQEIAV